MARAPNRRSVSGTNGGSSEEETTTTELGRPILPSGITKIEQGARRVDADDLVALAAALEVSPPRLLLPGQVTPAEFVSLLDSVNMWLSYKLGEQVELAAQAEQLEKLDAAAPVIEAFTTAVEQSGVEPGWLLAYLEFTKELFPVFDSWRSLREVQPTDRDHQ